MSNELADRLREAVDTLAEVAAGLERSGLCPVCKRVIAVSNVNRIVFAHQDTARNNCPMSGNPMGDRAA